MRAGRGAQLAGGPNAYLLGPARAFSSIGAATSFTPAPTALPTPRERPDPLRTRKLPAQSASEFAG